MKKQEQWDNTHQRVLAAWNSGLNAKQIREELHLGENTVMRHLHAAGIFPQKLVEQRAAEKHAAEKAEKEAERIRREAFRDMSGEQLELFPLICEKCGRPIERGKKCRQCSEHVYTYDHKAVECQCCHRTFEAKQMGRSPKFCPECATIVAKERNRANKKVHKYPSDIAGSFNGRARKACRKHGGHYEPVNYKSIFERDGMVCYLCGVKLKDGFDSSPDSPTLDHVIPLARGGSHAPDNLKPCCFACNSKKSAALLEEVTCCA